MTNKKQKLLKSILIPTTALAVAGGTAGVILGLTAKSKPDVPPFLDGKTITYSAGNGSFVNGNHSTTFESGTTFDRIDQPQVKSNNKNELFAGWVDESGQAIRGNESVKKDMKLTATYSNSLSSEYAIVNFAVDPAEPGPVLQGNLRIAVNKGYFFFMVNRPTAKWTVTTKEGTDKTKYFKGWKYSDTGKQVKENDVIRNNVTLYPIFNEAVTMTWHPHGKNFSETVTGEGRIKRGQSTTTLESNTAFNMFNQPQLEFVYNPTTQTDKVYFAGWYKDEDCTTEWGPDEVITADGDAYAKWDDDPEIGDKYAVVTFNDARSTDASGATLPTMTYEWTPTKEIVVKCGDKQWGETNKPAIVCKIDGIVTKDYKVASWEIYDTVKKAWVTLDNSYVFPIGTKAFDVRPVLTFAIDSLTVYGKDSVELESVTDYNVLVEGGSSSSARKVTWQLVRENDGTDTPFPDAIAEINADGQVTVYSVSREVFETYNLDHFYVKATSQLDTTKTSYLRVSIGMPYVNNIYVWVHTEVSESSDPKWYFTSLENFCDTEASTVVMTGMDGTTKHTFEKSEDFTDTITFGTDLGTVPDNFLAGWTNFKGNIDFEHSSIVSIGDNFMAGCTSFNNSLYLNNIIEIGTNFLKGCTSYNKPIDFSGNATLVYIGEAFLALCTSFNSTITLPGGKAFEIDNAFLYGCTAYNQPLTLPSVISRIGDQFMCECNNFTSTLTTAVQMGNFVYSDSSLSSQDAKSNIATIGFSVAGTQAENFKKVFTTITGPDNYRTVKATAFDGQVTEEQFTAAKKVIETSFNFTATIPGYGTLETDDKGPTSSNAQTGYYAAKMTTTSPKGTRVAYLKALDDNHRRVINCFYEDGEFFRTVTNEGNLKNSTNYYQIIDSVQAISVAASSTFGDWTFDSSNKWYSIDFTYKISGYNVPVTVYFGFEQSGSINYFQLDIMGETELAITYSNWNKTTVKLPTLQTIEEATYNDSTYTITTSTATEQYYQIPMAFDIKAATKSLKISNDVLAADSYIEAFVFDTNGVEKKCGITRGAGYAIVAPEGGFAIGDTLMFAYEHVAESTIPAGTIFTAVADDTFIPFIVNDNSWDERFDNDNIFGSFDQLEKDPFSWEEGYAISNTDAFTFYVNVHSRGGARVCTFLNYDKALIKIGNTSTTFTAASSWLDVVETGRGTNTVQYAITIPKDHLTDSISIDLHWTISEWTACAFTCTDPTGGEKVALFSDAAKQKSIKWGDAIYSSKDEDYIVYLELDVEEATGTPVNAIDTAASTIAVGSDQFSFDHYINLGSLTITSATSGSKTTFTITFKKEMLPSAVTTGYWYVNFVFKTAA